MCWNIFIIIFAQYTVVQYFNTWLCDLSTSRVLLQKECVTFLIIANEPGKRRREPGEAAAS